MSFLVYIYMYYIIILSSIYILYICNVYLQIVPNCRNCRNCRLTPRGRVDVTLRRLEPQLRVTWSTMSAVSPVSPAQSLGISGSIHQVETASFQQSFLPCETLINLSTKVGSLSRDLLNYNYPLMTSPVLLVRSEFTPHLCCLATPQAQHQAPASSPHAVRTSPAGSFQSPEPRLRLINCLVILNRKTHGFWCPHSLGSPQMAIICSSWHRTPYILLELKPGEQLET